MGQCRIASSGAMAVRLCCEVIPWTGHAAGDTVELRRGRMLTTCDEWARTWPPREENSMRSLSVAFALALSVLLSIVSITSTAEAQNDHYKCFSVRDSAKVFKRAAADLTPAQVEFAPENCSIKPKSKQICAPSSKLVTSIVDGTDTPFAAQDLAAFQVCYRIKCAKTDLPPLEVSDQFGTRTIEKFRPSKLCVPAVLQ